MLLWSNALNLEYGNTLGAVDKHEQDAPYAEVVSFNYIVVAENSLVLVMQAGSVYRFLRRCLFHLQLGCQG